MRLLALLLLAAADLRWAPNRPGNASPPDAVALEGNTLLCRARLVDGNLHPGTASAGFCRIPQKGTVEKAGTFEIATGGRPVWVGEAWQNAIVAGRQGRFDLYFCRAPVRVGGGSAGWVYGKAYRDGPHAGRCYVAFDEREIEVSETFELLGIGK